MATKKPTQKRKTATRGKTPPKKTPLFRREVWGVIYIVLAIFFALALFGGEGIVLTWLKLGLGGLLGFGAYFLPPVLAFVGFLLLFRSKTALLWRLCGAGVLPVLVGAMAHALAGKEQWIFDVTKLAVSGSQFTSGGIVAGILGSVMVKGFSFIGALLILALLLFVAIFLTLDLRIKDVYELVFGYEPSDERYQKQEQKVKSEKLESIKARVTEQRIEKELKRDLTKQYAKQPIDIPLDEKKAEGFTGADYTITDFNPSEFDAAFNDASLSTEDLPRAVSSLPSEADILEVGIDPALYEATAPEVEADVEDMDLFVRAAKRVQPKPMRGMQPSPSRIDVPLDIEDSPPWDEETVSDEEQNNLEAQLENSLKQHDLAYAYPPPELLNGGKSVAFDATHELKESAERLIDTLKSFNVDAQIINIIRGPSVTRFEMQISRGTKFSKVTSLSDDIALSLGAVSVRIAPIPDKLAIGIEVPNKTVQTVFLREVITSKEFTSPESKLSFSVGKDITGAAIVGDVAKMPHMLIAGTTGSGKSVCINSILISILYKSTPDEVRLIMIDPKMIELGSYNGIPHLLIPVVTDPKKAAGALNWAVGEMMKRYKLFAEEGVRDLASYNEVMRRRLEEGQEAIVQPQIVIVIDELADLMMVAAREVEEAICRIAQMARAAGMHLIIATQRPSADVITGIMKANIPSRIAFAVASQIESRIILDQTGAEKLIGKGDMLYYPLGLSKPTRVQGCFLTSDEVNRVVDHVKATGTAEYSQDIIQHIERQAEGGGGGGATGGDGDDEDEMLSEAIEIAVDAGQISVSLLQRKLKLGYARAARLVDEMEERGIVGAFEGSKPRQVLISKQDWQEISLRRMDLP